MPSVKKYPGLAVDILVDTVPLEEHAAPRDESEDADDKAVRYVEAHAGANFEVCVRMDGRLKGALDARYDVAVEVYVDGGWTNTQYFEQANIPVALHRFQGVKHGAHGSWKLAKFMFGELVSDDIPLDELEGGLRGRIKELGEVRVCCYYMTVVSKDEVRGPERPPQYTTDPIPEKALKGRAISRKAGFGESEPTTMSSRVWKVNYITSIPFCTFTFRYRSMKDLRAERIILDSASPAPLEERPLESLTPAETRERLLRAERVVQRAQVKSEVKREREESSMTVAEDDEVEVLAERPVKRVKHIETIDLT